MHALAALVRKDLVLYFSNRRALIMSIAAPIAIAAFFGSLFDTGSSKTPARVPVAVVDLDGSEISKKIVASMKGDASFSIQELTEPAALEQVKKGKVRAAAVFPEGFGEQAARALFRPGSKPAVMVHYDPSQAMTLAVVRGLLTQHVMQSVSQAAFSGATAANAGAPRFEMPFETREREVTSNSNRKYNSYAHSFAGMGVQFILFMGIEFGIGVLLSRRLGLWKRLRAAPLSRAMLLGSRIASGALTAVILLVLIYAAAIAFFGVRIEGSAMGFVAVGFAFSILTASFGLLIAALGKTPEATRGLAIFATLILVMLGGAWVPTFIFPEWLQSVSLFVPTRWAVDGLDAMTWRGLGFEAALAPVGVMLAFSALFAAIAVSRFKWEE